MNRYRYLIKNIGLLTLSSFATKLLSFFLVPLYTSVLSTTDYGTYDLFQTTVGVLLPILTLNIQESVLRFALDRKYKKDAIVTVSMQYMLLGCTLVMAGLLANHVFTFSDTVKRYAVFFFLMYFIQVLSGIVVSYTRGLDKISELSISSVFASAVTIGCNILFLVVFKWGLIGYFLANIIGPLVQLIYLMLRVKMLQEMHLTRNYDTERKEMLRYCKPMIANSIAWWINNASDRYIVILFCGLAENGIYSVASKIPSILNIFQSIFNQAWSLSAVRDYDPDDKEGFFTNTYQAYNCFMVLLCSGILLFNKFLAHFLYAKDFYIAWQYVPWLTIAILFGALSGYLGGFFTAVKDSKIFAKSTMIGAVTNIVLNLMLTPVMGALGAAIATMICYFVVWEIRYIQSKRYIKLNIKLYRDVVSYAILVVQACIQLFIKQEILLYAVESILCCGIALLYVKDIFAILIKIRDR